ncbi:MAG: dipeptidase [Sulfobacillus acidophilus]|uniref:Dipeptidase n=1 Tax=Sulfobacillus acidophilus TaxID=53633 RepID=A0A2T2WER7_9FIRM|nr:MAG: dipeptidase [Sulfobacillus acidophilus]
MPDNRLQAALSYLKAHYPEHLEQLQEFLRIPSISALSQHAVDVAKAGDWLKQRLSQAGFFNAEVHVTEGHPIVTASTAIRPDRPTVLIYGHYDVQPVDPLPSWHHGPFEPTIIDDILYARGASDDKGQVFMQVIAAEAWEQTKGLPVNLKFLFEGEEEIGSTHLGAYIRAHQRELAADIAVISDTPMYQEGYPAISYGLRGLASLEISVEGPYQDLHSGTYGGTVMNPAHALAQLIAALHDRDGRVLVPGFYDQVDSLSPQEREALGQLPFDEEEFRKSLNVPQLFGEAGYSVNERAWVRPTLEVNGLWSGFTGEGQKTIIPASAHAKITCRLVPHQDPHQIVDAISQYLESHVPPGVRLRIQRGNAAPGIVTPIDHPAVQAAQAAIQSVYQTPASYIRMGGSIPVVVDFAQVLGMPTLLLGFALPDENFHAPNEHFHLENFRRGAATLATLWQYLGGNHD